MSKGWTRVEILSTEVADLRLGASAELMSFREDTKKDIGSLSDRLSSLEQTSSSQPKITGGEDLLAKLRELEVEIDKLRQNPKQDEGEMSKIAIVGGKGMMGTFFRSRFEHTDTR